MSRGEARDTGRRKISANTAQTRCLPGAGERLIRHDGHFESLEVRAQLKLKGATQNGFVRSCQIDGASMSRQRVRHVIHREMDFGPSVGDESW